MTNSEAVSLLMNSEYYKQGYKQGVSDVLNKIRVEIEQLPTKTRINWDGICPDPYYPEIEYIDVTKKYLLKIIDKYKLESEEV